MVRRLMLAVLLLFAVAACGDDDADTADDADDAADDTADQVGDDVTSIQVDVRFSEFAITVDPASAAAGGGVDLVVTNDGVVEHVFKIVASDAAPDALPTTATGDVDADQVEAIEFDNTTLGAGDQQIYSSAFDPGSYVIYCSVPGHYGAGMTAGLEIT